MLVAVVTVFADELREVVGRRIGVVALVTARAIFPLEDLPIAVFTLLARRTVLVAVTF